MSTSKKTIAMFFNSDTTNTNVIYRSSTYSTFRTALNPAFSLPLNASNIKARLVTLDMWNTVVNISSSLGNNKLYVSTSTSGTKDITITIPNGLYDISALNSAINIQMALVDVSYKDTVILLPDYATSRIIFQVKTGKQLIFDTDSPYTLLGVTSTTTVPNGAMSTSNEYTETATNKADFATFDSMAVHAPDITSASIFAGKSSDVLCGNIKMTNTAVGSNFLYAPFNPVSVEADLLGGGKKLNDVTFYITDQAGTLLDLNGENWGITLEISYEVPEN